MSKDQPLSLKKLTFPRSSENVIPQRPDRLYYTVQGGSRLIGKKFILQQFPELTETISNCEDYFGHGHVVYEDFTVTLAPLTGNVGYFGPGQGSDTLVSRMTTSDVGVIIPRLVTAILNEPLLQELVKKGRATLEPIYQGRPNDEDTFHQELAALLEKYSSRYTISKEVLATAIDEKPLPVKGYRLFLYIDQLDEKAVEMLAQYQL